MKDRIEKERCFFFASYPYHYQCYRYSSSLMEWNNLTRPILQCNHNGIHHRLMYIGHDVNIHFRIQLSIRKKCICNVMLNSLSTFQRMRFSYVMNNIFHSILVSRHKFHFYIVHESNSVRRKSIVHTKLRSILGCNDTSMIHKFHLGHNLGYKLPENNHVRSSDGHISTTQFRDHNVHDPNTQANTGRLAGHECHNLRLAIQPCRNIDRKRSFHDLSMLDLGSQLSKK